MKTYSPFVAVIGLEVHIQLLTESKLFSSEPNQFGGAPNEHISPILLAHPGTLPKLNKQAVELAIRMGFACHCSITRNMLFDRKNYFYPDLPRGYQITQLNTPICVGGFVTIKHKDKARDIQLNRIHLEDDAGKLVHGQGNYSLVDYNRAGTPLIELVTEPVLHHPEEAGYFLTEIRKLIRHLGVSDGNMEEGSLRCDANVSIRPEDSTTLGTKVEIKNLNSIKFVEDAIEVEIQRQIALTKENKPIVSETRLYDVKSKTTVSMRSKEEENDYRYFPDPDVCPIHISDEWLNSIKVAMPALPHERKKRWMEKFSLTEYDAEVLADNKEVATFFDALCEHTAHYKTAANIVMGSLKHTLEAGEEAYTQKGVTPKKIAEVIQLLDENKISFQSATHVLIPALAENKDNSVATLAENLNILQQDDDGLLDKWIDEIIFEFPLKVEEYKKGKKAIVTLFMGELMKRSKGKINPKKGNERIIQKLNTTP